MSIQSFSIGVFYETFLNANCRTNHPLVISSVQKIREQKRPRTAASWPEHDARPTVLSKLCTGRQFEISRIRPHLSIHKLNLSLSRADLVRYNAASAAADLDPFVRAQPWTDPRARAAVEFAGFRSGLRLSSGNPYESSSKVLCVVISSRPVPV